MDLKKHKARAGGPDMFRVGALVVLLILVMGLFLWMQTQKPSAAPLAPADESMAPEDVENAEVAAKVDPALLAKYVEDETEDQQVVIEQHALLHLLVEANKTVPGDFRRLEASRVDEGSFQQWLDESAQHRGDPVMTKARVTAIQELKISTDLEDPQSEQQLTYWRLLASDQEGNSYAFSSLSEPSNEPGDVVRLEGFFYKVQKLFDETDLLGPFLHLVGKRAVSSFFRWDPVEELSPKILDAIADYTIEDEAHIEEEPLYHVLSFLESVDADHLASYGQDVTSASLRLNPERFRGKPVRVLGTYFESWGRQLGPNGENPLEWPSVQHGLLVHAGPSFTYIIGKDLMPEYTAEENTNVIVEGLFFKKYLYSARNGETIECPLIVVKRVVPFNVDTSSASNIPAYAIVIIGALLLGWFWISAVGDRNASEEFRKRYFREKRKQVKRNLGETGQEA